MDAKEYIKYKILIDSLYTNYLLRDFLSKIIPGMILLFTIYLCFFWENNSSSYLFALFIKFSLMAWISIMGVSWLIGMSIQKFGESFP